MVLFINADAEFHAGRAQNFLRPEHVEKIIRTFQAFKDVPDYAAVVPYRDIVAKGYDCNIRRYADNAPPPESHDVRAHLTGGVPKAEVDASSDLFVTHGVSASTFFTGRNNLYLDFASSLSDRTQIKTALEADSGLRKKESKIWDRFAEWWEGRLPSLRALAECRNLMQERATLLDSFVYALKPVGLLDPFEVAGVAASWWNDSQYEFRTIAAVGFDGLIDGWVATIEDMLTPDLDDDDVNPKKKDKGNPFEHKLIGALLPDYLVELEQAEAEIIRLQGELDAFDNNGEADEGEEDDLPTRSKELEARIKQLRADIRESTDRIKDLGKGPRSFGSIAHARKNDLDAQSLVDELSELEREILPVQKEIARIEAELEPFRTAKSQLAEARRKLRQASSELLSRLKAAVKVMSSSQKMDLTLRLEREAMSDQLDRYVAAHRQEISEVVERLWDKYRVPMRAIDTERKSSATTLSRFLEKLGYVNS